MLRAELELYNYAIAEQALDLGRKDAAVPQEWRIVAWAWPGAWE